MAVHFVLKRFLSDYGDVDLYEAIKSGKKTSEFRDATDYWARRLLNDLGLEFFQKFKERFSKKTVSFIFFNETSPYSIGVDPSTKEVFGSIPYSLKQKEATFRVGYTKGPTLHAGIKDVIWRPLENQFEVRLENVYEEES